MTTNEFNNTNATATSAALFSLEPPVVVERRIEKNAFGNWFGYVDFRRVDVFTTESAAIAWRDSN